MCHRLVKTRTVTQYCTYSTACGRPSHIWPVGQGGKGVITDSKITLKSNCHRIKTEGPATHHGHSFFPLFFLFFSLFPIWLKISHCIRKCLIFKGTHYSLPTSNKGGNYDAFSTKCCFSPQWLTTACVSPCKIGP
jgi:hypothetical protein